VLDVDSRGIKTRDVTYQASAVSAYVQDIVQAGDWTITPGLRAEYYTQTRQRRALITDLGPHESHNGLLLPSISVLYTGLPNTQIFANIARGYTPAPARTAEDFPLKPETGINSQLGLRSTAVAGFSVESAIFFNRITNTVVQLPFLENGINVVLNSADSRSYRVDLGLQFDTDRYQHSALNLFVQLAWNYTRAEFTENFAGSPIKGKRVPEIPEHSGSITIGVQSQSGWQLSASLSRFGQFYTDPLNTEALVLADEDREPVGPGAALEIREPAVLGSVASHSLLSARASYQFTNHDLQVWLQGRNLADKKYITDLENGIRPGARRTLVAGVKLGF
jgi:Fe(3+) dicitrate transport protein